MSRLRSLGRHLSQEPRAIPKLVLKNLMHPFTRTAAEERWDRARDIDTGGWLNSSELGRGSDGSNVNHAPGYAATPPLVIEHLLNQVADICGDTSRFTFLDYGSGKGRVLMMAARRRFTRVIGIEFSEDLCDIANTNVAKFRHRSRERLAEIEIVRADVEGFELPIAPLIIWLFNPFTGPVMRKVATRILASIESAPREVAIVYYNPAEPEAFESPYLEKIVVSDLPVDPTDRYRGSFGALILRTSVAHAPI
jgi:SAM-dependent methyltransferase